MKATAFLIVEKNLTRNATVDHNLELWQDRLEETAICNSSCEKTDGEGYYGLVGMGPWIITRLMLEYYKEQTGWWHELLHELVHDEKSGSPVFFKPQLFEAWRAWFEGGEWKDVPKGRGTEGERLYKFIHAPEAE